MANSTYNIWWNSWENKVNTQDGRHTLDHTRQKTQTIKRWLAHRQHTRRTTKSLHAGRTAYGTIRQRMNDEHKNNKGIISWHTTSRTVGTQTIKLAHCQNTGRTVHREPIRLTVYETARRRHTRNYTKTEGNNTIYISRHTDNTLNRRHTDNMQEGQHKMRFEKKYLQIDQHTDKTWTVATQTMDILCSQTIFGTDTTHTTQLCR